MSMQHTTEQWNRLTLLVNALNVDYGHEQSVKLLAGTLLVNRFLLTINKNALAAESRTARILDVCRQMGMPDNYLKAFAENLPESDIVHFGFEEDRAHNVYKVYLEPLPELNKEPSDTQLLYIGYKWNTLDNAKQALSHYTYFPGLAPKKVVERLAHIYDSPGNSRVPFEIVQAILDIAFRRVSHERIRYLEVSEGSNPRKSFNLNIYAANIKIREVRPLLAQLFQHFGIPAEQFQALMARIGPKKFGNLSGGINREGKAFFTLYYGAEERHPDTLPHS
jgi:hypothetical protein